eukprot:6200613-Pleurochrysis_carterae.AAC.4
MLPRMRVAWISLYMQSSNDRRTRKLGHPEHSIGSMTKCDTCSGTRAPSVVHSMAKYTRFAHAKRRSIKTEKTS